jgi:hypothetical protein
VSFFILHLAIRQNNYDIAILRQSGRSAIEHHLTFFTFDGVGGKALLTLRICTCSCGSMSDSASNPRSMAMLPS